MNENTHMRITRSYLAKLHKLCETSKRKPAKEIEWLIDQALLNRTQTIKPIHFSSEEMSKVDTGRGA